MCTERKTTGKYVLECFLSATMPSILIAYAQKPILKALADMSSGAKFWTVFSAFILCVCEQRMLW